MTTTAVEPNHIKASKAVRRRRPADSQALFDAVEARRLTKPVIVTGVKIAKEITVVEPSNFGKLNIDGAYQREKHSKDVNRLVSVLRQGGQIPDPIVVSERPDGSWWIVEGQQRFWAHEEMKLPVKALIHVIDNVEMEAKLFFALNSRHRLSPRALLKGWPGPAGDFVRRMANDERSPLRGTIDLTNNSKLPLDGVTVVKALLVLTTGIEQYSHDFATTTLPRLDSALKVPGMNAWAEAFMQLVAAVFANQASGRVRIMPVIALARVTRQKFMDAGRIAFPRTTANLRRINWNTIVPTHASQFMPIMEREILKRWK